MWLPCADASHAHMSRMPWMTSRTSILHWLHTSSTSSSPAMALWSQVVDCSKGSTHSGLRLLRSAYCLMHHAVHAQVPMTSAALGTRIARAKPKWQTSCFPSSEKLSREVPVVSARARADVSPKEGSWDKWLQGCTASRASKYNRCTLQS